MIPQGKVAFNMAGNRTHSKGCLYYSRNDVIPAEAGIQSPFPDSVIPANAGVHLLGDPP